VAWRRSRHAHFRRSHSALRPLVASVITAGRLGSAAIRDYLAPNEDLVQNEEGADDELVLVCVAVEQPLSS
jgi:hypothetical protein